MNLMQSPAATTILLAEDESSLRDLVTLILESHGHRVLPAHDGNHAVQIAASFEGVIHLLLSDVTMPGMTGPSLARQLQITRPGTPVILMSGYAPPSTALDGSWVFLNKPVGAKVLLHEVDNLLGRTAGSHNTAA